MSVYFAQVGGYIKVGSSDDPERRVRRLFSSETRYCKPDDCPTDAGSRRLLLTIPGSLNVEWSCHRALDDFRVVGEFFIDEPGVRDFMERAALGDLSPVERPGGPIADMAGNVGHPEVAEALGRIFAQIFPDGIPTGGAA